MVIGAAAGACASYPLLATSAAPQASLLLGAAIGAAFTVGLGRAPRARFEGAMAAAALGVPLWILVTCIALPALGGRAPALGAEQMRAQFPSLVGWTLYGCLMGVFAGILGALADRLLGAQGDPAPEPVRSPTRIVVLGGGFAGMTTAACLEEELRGDPAVLVTLVSDQNSLLFTPMLAEVAGGS